MHSAVRAGTECLKLFSSIKPQGNHHTYFNHNGRVTVKREEGKSVFSPAVYHAIYLEELTAAELTEKLAQLFNISPRQISQIFKQGPTGIHVLVSDEVRSGFSSSFTGSRESVWSRNL